MESGEVSRSHLVGVLCCPLRATIVPFTPQLQFGFDTFLLLLLLLLLFLFLFPINYILIILLSFSLSIVSHQSSSTSPCLPPLSRHCIPNR